MWLFGHKHKPTFNSKVVDVSANLLWLPSSVMKQVFRVKKTRGAPMGYGCLLASNGVHICHAI